MTGLKQGDSKMTTVKIEKHKSGLIVVQEQKSCLTGTAEPPSPENTPRGPTRGPLEITDVEKRKRARSAIGALWCAMDMPRTGGWIYSRTESPVHDARYRAWRHLGEMILGDECEDGELLT